VEGLLKQKEVTESGPSSVPATETDEPFDTDKLQDVGFTATFVSNEQTFGNLEQGGEFTQFTYDNDLFYQPNEGTNSAAFLHEEFTWSMIGLGVEEPLPPQETIDEL
jgi:hypothetical protein